MASYHQFTQEDRIMLSTLKGRGLTQREIAREVNKDQSSVSRELKRNSMPNTAYHVGYARQCVVERKFTAGMVRKRIENDPWLSNYIIRKIKKYWSPEHT